MTGTFTASNGMQVAWMPNGRGMKVLQTNAEYATRCLPEAGWRVVGDATRASGNPGFTEESALAVALREFFLHERDTELGRWRSKVHPYWTGMVDEAQNIVKFRSEDGLREFTVHLETRSYSQWVEELREVAREYLDAHPGPEPKPWHDAKHNELWEVQIRDCHGPEIYRCAQESTCMDSLAFRPVNTPGRVWFDPRSKDIKSARRIWPEVVSDA